MLPDDMNSNYLTSALSVYLQNLLTSRRNKTLVCYVAYWMFSYMQPNIILEEKCSITLYPKRSFSHDLFHKEERLTKGRL